MFHAACVFRDLCQPNYSWEQASNRAQMMLSLGWSFTTHSQIGLIVSSCPKSWFLSCLALGLFQLGKLMWLKSQSPSLSLREAVGGRTIFCLLFYFELANQLKKKSRCWHIGMTRRTWLLARDQDLLSSAGSLQITWDDMFRFGWSDLADFPW